MKWTVIFLSLVFTSAPLTAQDKAEEENTEKEVQVAQADRDKKKTEKEADDYRPSEEISEDLSVSYPIDI
ncbi:MULTISPECIES: hypothetical protein [unclassified Microbulbifer]|uniref:hypothetical protein n=1 Tax=unclassified Microbulbifer TaxID=2619833 RepID=UPI0027E4C85B|nr:MULTISPECIES: hypothetical protein [unclassified Microbulbifer]